MIVSGAVFFALWGLFATRWRRYDGSSKECDELMQPEIDSKKQAHNRDLLIPILIVVGVILVIAVLAQNIGPH